MSKNTQSSTIGGCTVVHSRSQNLHNKR